MLSKRFSHLAVAVLFAMPAASISAPLDTIYTPAKGSAERAAILDGLRAIDGEKPKFTVHAMNVFHHGSRAIAVVNAEADPGDGDPADWVLTSEGNGPWKAVWGVGGGGSNSCIDIADAYREAQALARRYGADPAKLMPTFVSAERDAREAGAGESDTSCVGDIQSF
jgi:hypothetical protein